MAIFCVSSARRDTNVQPTSPPSCSRLKLWVTGFTPSAAQQPVGHLAPRSKLSRL